MVTDYWWQNLFLGCDSLCFLGLGINNVGPLETIIFLVVYSLEPQAEEKGENAQRDEYCGSRL